jgi:hypothetical protein
MGSEAGLVVSGFNREISEALRFVEPAEQQAMDTSLRALEQTASRTGNKSSVANDR